jgi:hypothetical protein
MLDGAASCLEVVSSKYSAFESISGGKLPI